MCMSKNSSLGKKLLDSFFTEALEIKKLHDHEQKQAIRKFLKKNKNKNKN